MFQIWQKFCDGQIFHNFSVETNSLSLRSLRGLPLQTSFGSQQRKTNVNKLQIYFDSFKHAMATTKIILPLYVSGDASLSDPNWKQVLSAITQYPTLNFLVIINPSSGPGTLQDMQSGDWTNTWVAVIAQLKQASNVTMLGYVDRLDDNGNPRTFQAQQNDVQIYFEWTSANTPNKQDLTPGGIFFDDVTTDQPDAVNYQSLIQYTQTQKAGAITVLNPGTVPNAAYFNIGATEIVIHETSYADYNGGDNAVPSGVPYGQFSVIINQVPTDSYELGTLANTLIHNGYGSIYINADGSYSTLGTTWPTFCSDMYDFIYGCLLKNQGIVAGRSLESPNGQYTLSMQTDGNLVLYNNQHVAVWSSGTAGNPNVAEVLMQTDGNLVVYTTSSVALWNSKTSGNPGAYLRVQNNGTLVVYSANNVPLWTS